MKLVTSIVASLALSHPAQLPPVPHRARDPWVFRSVLDQRPRMVTFALCADMWAAYDATTCTLYKAWKGGVHFDGAVYTTVHGPQPTSEGRAYTEGVEGDAWEVFVDDKRVEASVRWKGYTFHDGRCTLNYRCTLPDGHAIDVLETPEFVHPEDLFDADQIGFWALKPGEPGLLRSFMTSELPANAKITLKVCVDGAVGRFCEAEERDEKIPAKDSSGAAIEHTFLHVALVPERHGVNNLILFFAPLADVKPTSESATKKEGAK
jgi:cytochrome c